MKTVISISLLALIFWGCNSQKDSVKYAEDAGNGLKKEVNIGEVHYTIQYKTPGYIVEKEHLDSIHTHERMEQLKGTVWFNVSFKINGFEQSPLRYKVSGLEEYTQRQNYYLNEAPRDIYLMYGNDSLFVESYWFENNQNLAPFETMIVGFKLPISDSIPMHDLKFSFYDRVFKNGIIKSIIKEEDIKHSQTKIQ